MPHIHNVARNSLRVDPTRTGLIRKQFQAEILRRLKAIRDDVREFLVELDALGLDSISGAGNPSGLLGPSRGIKIGLSEGSNSRPTIHARPQPREFQFRTSAAKLKAFRDWLQDQIEARVFIPEGGTLGKPWTAKYIESAYKRGRFSAFAKAKGKQAIFEPGFTEKEAEMFMKAFTSSERTSKIELLATRALEELRGVTSVMAQKMNRVLATGMAEGRGATSIAREISTEVKGISKTRALMIARTETINAHAEGTLDAFKELGVEDVGLMAEWSTAGDSRVCPQCSAMEGKKFSLKEARGLIPAHPNCRCAWIPFVPTRGNK